MTVEEMVIKSPGLDLVSTQIMNKIAIKMVGEPLNFNKTWADNGYDELDAVEFIMELEKELNISISDDVADVFMGGSPIDLTSYYRDKLLNSLGI